jgi:hypothetical protein
MKFANIGQAYFMSKGELYRIGNSSIVKTKKRKTQSWEQLMSLHGPHGLSRKRGPKVIIPIFSKKKPKK